MRLAVDAGVAVKWLAAEEGSDAADRLLANGGDLYAPRLMASEVANAPWRKVSLECPWAPGRRRRTRASRMRWRRPGTVIR